MKKPAKWGKGSLLVLRLSFVLWTLLGALDSHGKEAEVKSIVKSTVQFTKQSIFIGVVKLNAEVAQSEEQLQQGLMFRQSLAENQAMLFIFSNTQVRSFWMKNTLIPLSIGFFDENRRLINILDMAPMISEMQQDLPLYKSSGPAKYAVETVQGWYSRHKIKVGDSLKLE